MTSARLFLAFFCIFTGIGLLLMKAGILVPQSGYAPYILSVAVIAFGLSLMASGSGLKTAAGGTAALLSAYLLFSFFSSVDKDYQIDIGNARLEMEAEVDEVVKKKVKAKKNHDLNNKKKIKLNLHLNAQDVSISDGKRSSLSLKTKGLDLSYFENGDYYINLESKPEEKHTEQKIVFNSGSDSEVNAYMKDGKLHADLETSNVSAVKVASERSKIDIKLGCIPDRIKLDIGLSNSALQLHLPKSSGCEFTGDMKGAGISLAGLYRSASGTYRTPNYDTASKKIQVALASQSSMLDLYFYNRN